MTDFGLDGYKQGWKDKLFGMSFIYMFLIIININTCDMYFEIIQIFQKNLLVHFVNSFNVCHIQFIYFLLFFCSYL